MNIWWHGWFSTTRLFPISRFWTGLKNLIFSSSFVLSRHAAAGRYSRIVVGLARCATISPCPGRHPSRSQWLRRSGAWEPYWPRHSRSACIDRRRSGRALPCTGVSPSLHHDTGDPLSPALKNSATLASLHRLEKRFLAKSYLGLNEISFI
jgi:hypothetical protein